MFYTVNGQSPDTSSYLAGAIFDRTTGRALRKATLRDLSDTSLSPGRHRVTWDTLADIPFRPSATADIRLFIGTIPPPEAEEEEVEEEPSDLLYYCTFDSPASIEHPAAGPAGRFLGGEFHQGKVGKALWVAADTPAFETRFPRGFLGSEGTIEFWARIGGDNPSYVDGGDPLLISLYDERGTITLLQFAANEGHGHGGLGGAMAGWPFATISYSSMSMDYASVIGSSWAGWHHYAMTWKASGFGDGSYVKVFVDGTPKQIFGGIDDNTVPSRLADFGNHSYLLGAPWHSAQTFDRRRNRRPFLIDEFKIWSAPKTQFSLL